MPPKKAATKDAKGPGAKRGGGVYSRPDPIPNGAILTDLAGKQWRIGKSIGAGGFGEIYLASDDISKPVNDKAPYVVKIEPHDNGPLFVEINVYIRIAKPDMIEEWKKAKRCENLGMPWYVTSGNHEDKRYRFMVIPRFGQDLQKVLLEKPGKRFHIKTVQSIALQVIDTLEYIHSKDYIHGDIKASNLMVGLPGTTKKSSSHQQVYLLDYGLASKYVNSERVHVAYEKDLRKAHNGTLEYTSRDAHIGAFSRRGDLEILGYNLLEWLCGKLPWSATDTPDSVAKQKNAFMTQIKSNGSLKKIYPTSKDIPGLDILEAYLRYVSKLEFDEEPDYKLCKDLLKKGISKYNTLYLDEVAISPPPKSKATGNKWKRLASAADVLDGATAPPEVVPKKLKIPDEDDVPVKRGTRTTKKVNINWTRVLSSDPEKIVRSVNGSSNKETTPSPSKSPPIVNPTPAMLQILHKRKENMATPVVSSSSSSRARSPGLRAAVSTDDLLLNGNLAGRPKRGCASKRKFEDKAATLVNPTPAMLQVLAKTTSRRK